ncbi:MAG: hypothetical protein A2020_14465 [Lentisphaerae bacterium GWF2_45_14]|nr:MAG: hypothetical protein A2020_14465 [Lentisphaerae bacterium GWF2_45_14]
MHKAIKTETILSPDTSRILFAPFALDDFELVETIISDIATMDEAAAEKELSSMSGGQPPDERLKLFLKKTYDDIKANFKLVFSFSPVKELLAGSYFSKEYSFESAGISYPSMMWHPDQSGLSDGSRRFIMSLIARGEGNSSIITFRSGTVDSQTRFSFDRPSPRVFIPDIQPDPFYEKILFSKKLGEIGFENNFTKAVFAPLQEHFTFSELTSAVRNTLGVGSSTVFIFKETAEAIIALAKSNFKLNYPPESDISERALFPASALEPNGTGDCRFVSFTEDDGSLTHYATYFEYYGHTVIPQIVETKDFLSFKVNTLNGPEIQNRQLALFPKKIEGYYAMLSRQDNRSIYIMFSDLLHFWYTKKLLISPKYPWELIRISGCCPPIETEAGWLVLTHGVGAMRKFCISAFLLDLHDPTRVIGRLREPLMEPELSAASPYMPGFIFTCGAQVHNDKLIIPYSISDLASGIAVADMSQLLSDLTRNA